MRVEKLSISNYRGINDLEVSFDPKITIFVGRNGIGKSSLLDALAVLLQPTRMLWPSSPPKTYYQGNINFEDVRTGCDDCKLSLMFSLKVNGKESSHPSTLSYNDIVNSQSPANDSLLHMWSYQTHPRHLDEEEPLLVYYRQDRGFGGSGSTEGHADVMSASSVSNSLLGDLRAIRDLEAWWDKRDAQEARQVRDKDVNYRDPQLQAIRTLITKIDSFKGITYSSTANPPGLYFETAAGGLAHVSQLSSGERSYIILLGDLARRLQLMSPDRKLSEIPGIVLIDEIELHLHPAWQSQVVPMLREIFSACQFIITTHSPQVISSVESQFVRTLSRSKDGSTTVEQPLNTKGRSSNYLLDGVFDASERYPEVDYLFDDFNQAIDTENMARARQILTRIKNSVDGEPPELLVLEKRLKKLESSK